MGLKMAMKLVSLFVLLIIMTNHFVECKFHVIGRERGHGVESALNQGEEIIVVAQDGSGHYSTIKEALNAIEGKSNVAIYIKRGVYSEYLLISKNMKNLRIIGEGKGATIITGNRGDSPYAGNYNLYNSATVAVEADGFVAQDITFRNTAGIQGNQSAALRVQADQVAFFKCSFEGYQDTIYVHNGRHFFKNCDIYGDVDFICGRGPALFQDCNIILRRPKTPNGVITIAASSREDPQVNEALVFQKCRISAGDELGETKIYLGRPWRTYAQTIFMKTSIDVPLQPAGWRDWEDGTESDKEAEKDVVYREYNNRGIGANTDQRVQWPGFKVITDAQEAEQFTVANLLQGNNWIPQTGLPFHAGI